MVKEKAKKAENIVFLIPPNRNTIVRDYYCTFSSKASYNWPSQDLVILSSLPDYTFHLLDCSKLNFHQSHSSILNYLEERGIAQENVILVFSTGSSVIFDDHQFCEYLKGRSFRGVISASSFFFRFLEDEYFKKLSAIDTFIKSPLHPFPEIESDKMTAVQEDDSFTLSNPPKHELFLQPKLFWHPLVKKSRFSVLVTSMGCPYHCSFCTLGGDFPYVGRDMNDISRDVEYIAHLNIKSILIQDPIFFVDKNRVIRIAALLKKHRILWTAQARADSIQDADFAKEIHDLGCYSLMIGVESLDNNTLKFYNKNISLDQIYNMFALCRKHSIYTLGFFIVNSDREAKIIRNNIKKVKRLQCDLASFSFLTFDHGSKIRNMAPATSLNPVSTADSTSRPEVFNPEAEQCRKKYIRGFYFRIKQVFRVINIFLESESKSRFLWAAYRFFIRSFTRYS